MKRFLKSQLIITSIILILLIFVSFYIGVVNDDWQIRKPWFSLVKNVSIALLFALFFISMTIKTLIYKKIKWIKYALALFYFAILLFSTYILVEKQQNDWIVLTAIISFLIISLLLILKGKKWKMILISIHTIIFSLVSIGFAIAIVSNKHKDRVTEDKAVLYRLVDGNKKVILQGDGVWEKEYLISNDFGFIRKRTEFDGNLPDGDWEICSKKGGIIAIITIKNGIEISRKNVISNNMVIVKSINDIKSNLDKQGLTFLFEGAYRFNESIELVNCRDLKFESVPGKIKANIETTSQSCFTIVGSSNVIINDIGLTSRASEAVIKIANSSNIKILNSKIDCFNSSDYGIITDENCRNIEITANKIQDPVKYSIVGFSTNAILTNNLFYLDGRYSQYKSVLFKDKQYDKNTAIDLAEGIILGYDGRNIENKSQPLVNLFGKRYINFKGTIDNLYDTYDIYNKLNRFMNDDYCSNCNCSSPYCANLLELISGEKLFISTPISRDKWCFDKENKPKFNFVNPAFFDWFSNKLNLQPDSVIQGVSYNYIYINLFSNITRDYYSVYQQMNSGNKLAEIIEKYKFFVDSAKTYSDIDLFLYYEFLNDKNFKINQHFYKKSTREENRNDLGPFYKNSDINLYETNIEIRDNYKIDAKDYLEILSFWIRREIDGSAKQIHKSIAFYLKKFDKEWLDKYRE